MALDTLVNEHSKKDPLVIGKVYGILLDRYTFEGTYAGTEREYIILRTGQKSDPSGTKRSFDHQELPLVVKKMAYAL